MPRSTRPGPVMAIGGAEDKLRDRLILSRFVELAGGTRSRIVVVSTASSLGDEATELYRALFLAAGGGEVTGLRPTTRDEAGSEASARPVERATGIFLTGGNQLRLSSIVAGTALGRAILDAHGRGAVVAGTSAGASALSTHMVAFGRSGATPKHRMVQLASGLGVVHDMVIDQHFEQRNRVGRLLAAIAQSPNLLGVGLDEDTAALIHDGGLEVVGKGAVTLIDGSHAVTDAFFTRGHRPMMVSGAVLHTLPAGWRFDLRERRLGSAPEEQAAGVSERADRRDLVRLRVRELARRVTKRTDGTEVPLGSRARRRARPLPEEEASE